MYKEFYGFSEKPFEPAPDPKFLYMAPSHFEAFSAMLAGITERKGITTITGPVGVGKTTLIYALLNDLDRKVRTSVVVFTAVDFRELLKSILHDFGIPAKENDLFVLMQRFSGYLVERLAADETVAIVIDEAQNLSVGVLRDLLRLATRSHPSTRMLQLVLVGQPEFETKLNSNELKDLREKIAVRRQIRPLNQEESRVYIDHRLRKVGGNSAEIFTPNAVDRICEFAEGIPRVINMACDRALLIGYSSSSRKISSGAVKEATKELSYFGLDPIPSPQPRTKSSRAPSVSGSGPRTVFFPILAAGSILATAVLITFAVMTLDLVPWKPLLMHGPSRQNAGQKTSAVVFGQKGDWPLWSMAAPLCAVDGLALLDIVPWSGPGHIERLYRPAPALATTPQSLEEWVAAPRRDVRRLAHPAMLASSLPGKGLEFRGPLKDKTFIMVCRRTTGGQIGYRITTGAPETKERGLRAAQIIRRQPITDRALMPMVPTSGVQIDRLPPGSSKPLSQTAKMVPDPAFDCGKAATRAERMICASPELSEADVRLARAFGRARRSTSDVSGLKAEQVSWLRRVRDACPDAECMLQAYETRIKQLTR